jgi:hypothetical protein
VLVHVGQLAVAPVGAQRGELLLDPVALTAKQLSGSVGFHGG